MIDLFLDKLPARVCVRCGATYKPRARSQKYCGDVCADAVKAERRPAATEPGRPGPRPKEFDPDQEARILAHARRVQMALGIYDAPAPAGTAADRRRRLGRAAQARYRERHRDVVRAQQRAAQRTERRREQKLAAQRRYRQRHLELVRARDRARATEKSRRYRAAKRLRATTPQVEAKVAA